MGVSLVINPPNSIANRFIVSLSSSSSSSLNDKPRALALPNLHGRHSSPSKPILGFPPLRMTKRSSFVASLSAQQSPPTNSDEENPKYPTDVKTLIRVYREALSNGDEQVASAIEAGFCKIEKEKDKMDHKVLSLSMEIASGRERFIRLQADFDNTRKKFDKDRLGTESNAKAQVMKSLLPIVDSFEKAKLQIKAETEKEKKIDTSYQGIYRQFVEVLRSLRVSAIATVGKPFDPLLHEAISREECEEFRAGIITQELNRGFLLGDRVLRPAKVVVSAGLGQKTAPSDAGQTSSSAGIDVR